MKNLTLIVAIFFSTFLFSQKYSFDVKIVGKGTPIIMIPGYACSGEVWNETVEHLKNKYECHILTLPGFAGENPVSEPSLENLKTEIINYAKDKNLKNPILMGHSLGGFLSLWISSSAPDLFKKVVVVDGAPFFTALQNPNITAEQAKMFVNKDMVVKQMVNATDEQMKTNAENTAKMMVSDSKYYERIVNWNIKSDKKTLGNLYYDMMTIDLRNEISKITAPVLVLGSDHQSMEENFTAQYKNLNNVTLHKANCKHFIMYDQPEWFYKEIDNFLK